MSHAFVVTPSPVATGTIRVCRFVKFDSSIDRGAAQAGAGDTNLYGVSGPAQVSPPGGPLISSAYPEGVIAAAGDSFECFGPGSSEVLLEVGAVAIAAGAWLKPDADGKAVVATTGNTAGARSMAAVDAGGLAPVWVLEPTIVP